MSNPPVHFVVFIPGYMGSRLRNRRTGEVVWLDIASLVRDPFNIPNALERLFTQMKYPNDDLIPDGVVRDVVFLPPLFKLEQYSRLIEAFKQMGYDISGRPGASGLAAYTFAYDWRQDNRISARQLGVFIEQLQKNHPGAKAVLIGHSNGGIVSRWYIEKEDGKDYVARLFLIGSPWDGAPKAFQVLQEGLDVFLLRLFSRSDEHIQEKIRDVILSFPSFYQLLPAQTPFVLDPDDSFIDLYKNLQWLKNDRQRQMLLDGRRFSLELGTDLSVETLCFFGVKQMTTTGCKVRLDPLGIWTGFEWERRDEGDGTVPLLSAVHPNASQKLPFVASHGDIYVTPPVLAKLEYELITQYQVGAQAQLATPRLAIHFDTDRDAYQPEETIRIWATVALQDNHAPVYGAKVEAHLELSQAIAGFPTPTLAESPVIRLYESGLESGRYEGALNSPSMSGYYRVILTVQAPGEAPFRLEELVLIEGSPLLAQTASTEPGLFTTGTPPATPKGFGDAPPSSPAGGPVFRSWDEPAVPVDLQTPPASAIERGIAPPSPTPGTSTSTQADPGPTAKGRFLNAAISDHPSDRPLPFGQESTLEIFIDVTATAAGVRFRENGLFAEYESIIRLQAFLSSTDFIVHTRAPQELRIPRSGRSRNKVRFDIEPRHSGDCRASVLLYKNNNFVQGIDLEFTVAASNLQLEGSTPAIQKITPIGRSVENLSVLQPRDVLLFIKNRGDSFDLTLVDEVVTEARLPLSLFQLNGMIARARQALADVVYLGKGASGISSYRGIRPPANVSLVFQAGIDIPEEVNTVALQRLAEEGMLIYQDLFYSPSAGPDARQMGDRLRLLAQQSHLKMQIISQHFFLPWGMIYLGDDLDHIDPENFLGMRHMVEHIPLQAIPPVFLPDIPSLPTLSVSLNVDPSIDQSMGSDFVAQQLGFWQRAESRGVNVVIRKSDQEWLQAMKEPPPDQLLYFYGHALTPPSDDPSGPDSASLSFGNQQKVSLRDLRLRDPQTRRFPGQPLVFINACESAELSPLFYGGFMPYFTAKGARGMIGTECETPAVFAAEWARRFFDRFLYQQQAVGRTFLDLRREFYYKHNNILGVLYALYCDGDTLISPPLSPSQPD